MNTIRFLVILLSLTVLGLGQVPSFKSFNTNQFSTNNFIVSIKDGVLLTNITVRSGASLPDGSTVGGNLISTNSGTTINPTDGFLPYRFDATTFENSSLAVFNTQTNVLLFGRSPVTTSNVFRMKWDGSLLIGGSTPTNITSRTPLLSYTDVSRGDQSLQEIFLQTRNDPTSDYFASFDAIIDAQSVNPRSSLELFAQNNAGTYSDIVLFSDPDANTYIQIQASGSTVRTRMWPNVADDGVRGPYVFDSSAYRTNLTQPMLAVKNFGTNLLTVANNSGYSGAGTLFLSDDGTYKTAGGSGDTLWTNITGYVTMIPGQTATNTLSFVSGAADNATNILFNVDSANTLSASGTLLARFGNAGTNNYVISHDGAVTGGRNTAAVWGSNAEGSTRFLDFRQVSGGDSQSFEYDFGSFHSDFTAPYAYFSFVGDTNDATLTLYSFNGVDTDTIELLQNGLNSQIRIIDGGVPVMDFQPDVASGSAIAYLFDTSNTMTNGDSIVSIKNAGTEQAYVTPLGYYVATKGSAYLAANATSTDATMANLSLSTTVNSGKKYSFKLVIYCANSTAADGAKFDFDGGSATATNFRVHGTGFDSALVASTQTSALATDIAAATITGDSMFTFEGSFEPSASGTLIPRFACNADTTGTLTVYRGSHLIVTEIP